MPRKTTNRAAKPKASRPQAPGYGFPTSSKGLLPWSWAEQRLKKSHNYWITTVKTDHSPHTMVVWGLWQDGRFALQHGQPSRKKREIWKRIRTASCAPNMRTRRSSSKALAEIADVAVRKKFYPSTRRNISSTCRR